MRNVVIIFLVACLIPVSNIAQSKDSLMVAAIIKEATENSNLKKLGQELFDGIGPRLVGSPKMQQAHDWAVSKYITVGI